MSKYKAVLFDFDGTIFNSNDIIIESWEHTFMKVLGRKPELSEVLPTFGEPLTDSSKRIFPDCDPKDIVATYREYQDKLYKGRVSEFPWLAELIAKLKEEGYLVAIVTSRLMSIFHTGPYDAPSVDKFDVIVSYEDTPSHKPAPDCILIALEKLGISEDEAIYIGDSKIDMLCARNAGVDCALVGWSVSVPEEQRSSVDCDTIINNPEDLIAYLSAAGV